MKIKQHLPSGLWVSDTGLVCMPPTRGRGGSHSKTFYWTSGCLQLDGYLTVTWKKVRYRVHRMVLETFGTAPSDNRILVDHINRNKTDNRIENLRWATYRENTLNSSWRENGLSASEGLHCGPEYARRYYEIHKEERLSSVKRWRKNNADHWNAYQRGYKRAHYMRKRP